MNRLASIGMTVFMALPMSSVSWAADGNSNGFDDAFERPMAVKFCPALVLDAGDNHVSPEPVEIMGPLWATMLYYPNGGQYSGELITGLAGAYDYSQYNSWEDAGNDDPPDGFSQGNYGCGFRNTLAMFWHWDYAGTGAAPGGGNDRDCTTPISPADYDQPLGWHLAYQNGRPAYTTATGEIAPALAPGSQYPTTTYCHVFKADGKFVLQYWFFYPFNDWLTDHEGDWEHINVIVTSDDPATAQLVEVVYYFHHRYVVTTKNQLQDPINYDYHVVDTSHPVVFVGGFSSKTIFTGEQGSGYGSHGCYPAVGHWANVEERFVVGIFDDDISGNGDYIDWRTFAWNSCEGSKYGIVLIRNRNSYNFSGADMSMSWLSAKIPWGSTIVRSLGNTNELYQYFNDFIPAIGAAPVGPEQHDSWMTANTSTDEYSLYGIDPRPQANAMTFTPPAPPTPPAVTVSMFESPSLSQPLSGEVALNGTTCLPGGVVELSWRPNGSGDEWSTSGVSLVRPYSPLIGDVYARWNTGVASAGTHELRARVDMGGQIYEEFTTVTVEHRRTTVAASGEQFTSIDAALNWAEMGDTVNVSAGTYEFVGFRMKQTVQLRAQGQVDLVRVLPPGGGGILVDQALITVENQEWPATIDGFTLRREGLPTYNEERGMLITNSAIVIRNCKFLGFEAISGSGIAVRGASSVRLEDCDFQGNRITGAGHGAAIEVLGGNNQEPKIEVVNCTFQGNEARDAVFVRYAPGEPLQLGDPTVRFEGCVFSNNLSSSGVLLVSGAGNEVAIELDGCAFIDNIVTGDFVFTPPSAIYCESSKLALTNCTIASSKHWDPITPYAVGGVTVNGTYALSIADCIIASNEGPAIYGSPLSATMERSVAFGNSIVTGSRTDQQWVTAGTDVVNLDPAFCSVANGDYRLFAFSPAAAGAEFEERVGAFDIGCAPSAIVTAAAEAGEANFPAKPWVIVACPKGDARTLQVDVSLNAPVTRSLDASEFTLDGADCVSGVAVFVQNGQTIDAFEDAVPPDYETFFSHSYFGGYGVNDVDILLNGYPLPSQAHFEIRSMDINADGIVNMVDFASFGAAHASPPKPYNVKCDYQVPEGIIDLADAAAFGAHINHSKLPDHNQIDSEPEQSSAGVSLAFTEEFPTANTHRLYVDVSVENFQGIQASAFAMWGGSDRLSFLQWVPSETSIGEVLFTPIVRDEVDQLFFGVFVSESFTDSQALLGRLVFNVVGSDVFEVTEDNFVLTVGEVLLESAGSSPALASMSGVFNRMFAPSTSRIYHNNLGQNYPNPFNPSTTLAFSLKDASNVNLTIYDVAGRRVRELVNERRTRGAYKLSWDGRNDVGETVASGVYFYKLTAGTFTDTKKMTILK